MLVLESKVNHADIAAFADEKVNLKRDDVKAYREQVNGLRDRLSTYIDAHPDFDLVKMLHSGSVAKGTALKTIDDMDVAVYVTANKAPGDEKQLLEWLAERLREAYGELMERDQFKPQQHSVRVEFRGSGLDVDVAPVLYEGGADDRGYLIAKDTGKRVLTSIPLHLAFIRTRKDKYPHHFRQLVRLVKWWRRIYAREHDNFKFKSFMIELIMAHLFDNGFDGSDYSKALLDFFAYIRRTGLKERIIFTDYYAAAKVAATTQPIQIYDPVNPENNVAGQYTEVDRKALVDAAEDAADAIAFARRATTKTTAVAHWQMVLGPSFQVTS